MITQKRLTWAAIGVTCVAGFEGLRTYAYRDPVNIPTICYGETLGVKMGDRKTEYECKTMLTSRLEQFNRGVDKCIRAPMSESRRAAMVSFSYNVGTGAFCKSTLARRLNARDPLACDELLKWDKAGGRALPGLTRRRIAERTLCNQP
jgi:lysozyme